MALGELAKRFDYSIFDVDTRRFLEERAQRIHNLARMTATAVVQIGQYLTEVKARVGHGQFLKWIDAEFEWSERSAENFVNVARHFKSATVADMSIDCRSLYLIAAPKIPEPVRAEVIRRGENGEPINHAGTLALLQRFAETGELPKIETPLSEIIAERRAAMEAKQPALIQKTAAEMVEAAKLQERMKANSERMHAVMSVIRAIECLAGTNLTIPQIAKDIQRLDSPDKDWRGQVKQARQMLANLGTELKE